MDKALEARRLAYNAFENIPAKLQARAVEMARHGQEAFDKGQFEAAASAWNQMARLAAGRNPVGPSSKFEHETVTPIGKLRRQGLTKIRTITTPSGHRVRIGFPEGRRRRGSGRVQGILHPANENPRWTKIYQHCLKIYASKEGMDHQCDEKCAAANHNYVHKFTHDNSMIFGMPGDSRSNGYKYLLIINKD